MEHKSRKETLDVIFQDGVMESFKLIILYV